MVSNSLYKPAKINLTDAQIKKIIKQEPVRITSKQIGTGDKVVMLHPENHAKLSKAKKANRGAVLFLTAGEIMATVESDMAGTGFFQNLWRGLKKGFNFLKDSGVLSAAADAAVQPLAALTGQPQLVTAGRKLLRDTTGVGMKSQKKQYIRHRAVDLTGGSFKLN